MTISSNMDWEAEDRCRQQLADALRIVGTDTNCMVGPDGTQYGWARYSRPLADHEVPEGCLRVEDYPDELWVPEHPTATPNHPPAWALAAVFGSAPPMGGDA